MQHLFEHWVLSWDHLAMTQTQYIGGTARSAFEPTLPHLCNHTSEPTATILNMQLRVWVWSPICILCAGLYDSALTASQVAAVYHSVATPAAATPADGSVSSVRSRLAGLDHRAQIQSVRTLILSIIPSLRIECTFVWLYQPTQVSYTDYPEFSNH